MQKRFDVKSSLVSLQFGHSIVSTSRNFSKKLPTWREGFVTLQKSVLTFVLYEN